MIGDDGLLAACSPLHYFEEEEPSVNNNKNGTLKTIISATLKKSSFLLPPR
jgi:hypothetical protein